MKMDVLNNKGQKVDNIELKDSIFGATINTDIVAQYVNVYLSNQRQGTSSVKTRGDVSGGGKKPWKQKGTGRARHGSTRSPIWVHGGIAHGPSPKNWNLKMPKKMKKAALRSVLSQKYSEKSILILEDLKIDKPSTAKMMEIFESLKIADNKILLILDTVDKNIIKSVNNLPKVRTSQYNNLNAYDLINAESILFLRDSLNKFQEVEHASK